MRKFITHDTLGNSDTLFVKPSTKRPGKLIITMCNQHRIPMCLSNVMWSHNGGTAAARATLIDGVTTTWNAKGDIPATLKQLTQMEWKEITE